MISIYFKLTVSSVVLDVMLHKDVVSKTIPIVVIGMIAFLFRMETVRIDNLLVNRLAIASEIELYYSLAILKFEIWALLLAYFYKVSLYITHPM